MDYITSDTHFFHHNILKYEPESRPFETIEEMNEALIKNWNDKVKPTDTVYHLGDFCMGQVDRIDEIVPRLNGKIVLIRGNHDSKPRIEKYKSYGIEIKDIGYLRYKGRFFIMCHFPNDNKEFIKMITQDNSEVVWLYGHVHHNAPTGYVDGAFHVGVDTNNLAPLSIEEIWDKCWPENSMTNFVKEYKAIWDNGFPADKAID